jgi:hypothetical protein
MAPFLSHLVVGERVWQALPEYILAGHVLAGHALQAESQLPSASQSADGNGYGSFLFGCLAADVDKFCEGLEQATTHMMAKDPAGTYAWERSRLFLERQTDLLRAPFRTLEPHERWFVLGYLCHLATDEITARRAGAMNRKLMAAGGSLPNIDALLTALDARVWAAASDPEGLKAALAAIPIADGTLVFAPEECLAAMHRIVLPQIRGGGGLEPYLNMVRGQWIWLRLGASSADAAELAGLEAEVQDYRRTIAANMPAAETWVAEFAVEQYVEEASSYSLQRIGELLGKEGSPWE